MMVANIRRTLSISSSVRSARRRADGFLALCLLSSFVFRSLLAAPAASPPPAILSTNVLTWPTMDYTNFLAGHPDEARRQSMWKYFLLAEREAKSLAGSRERWKPLKAVTLGTTGPKWFSTGRLQLSAGSAYGTMFHEIFHNTYDKSLLRRGEDNAWSEAFADAFRYMMEKQLLPEPRSEWFLKMDRIAGMTYAQMLTRSGNKRFDRKFCYPAALVIRQAGKDPAQFRRLWFELQSLRETKKTNVLDRYFGYDKQLGRPL